MPALSARLRAALTGVTTVPVVAALAMLAACSQNTEPTAAVSEADVVLAYVDAGLDADVADCLVGLGSRELDVAELLPGSLTGEEALLVDELTRSCTDAVAALSEVDIEAREDFGSGPFNIGDDQYLDGLWAGCEGGNGADCDRLWAEAPVGSIYESFGVTCGNRPGILDCTEEMNGPDRRPDGAR